MVKFPRRPALASLRALMIAALAAAALVAVPPTGAGAASLTYCVHYADLAVVQFNRNRSIPGCFHGADQNWHADFDEHYAWCVTASEAAAREADAYRGRKLHDCSLRAYGRD